jgi:hypothetical protein
MKEKAAAREPVDPAPMTATIFVSSDGLFNFSGKVKAAGALGETVSNLTEEGSFSVTLATRLLNARLGQHLT